MQADMTHSPAAPTPNQDGGNLLGNFNRSLRYKLIAALLGLGLIPLVFMAGLSYFRTQTVLKDSVNSELESVASLTADRVERWMMSREADAKTYSALQFAVGDANDALSLGIDVIVNQEGSQEARTATLAAQEAMPEILEATGTTYAAIYLTDINGTVVVGVRNAQVESADGVGVMDNDYYTGHRFQAGDSVEDTDLLAKARENGGIWRSPVIRYTLEAPREPEATEVTTMFIAHIVTDASTGEAVGGIVLQVNPAELQGLMGDFANDNAGKTYLESGNFLVTRNAIEPLDTSKAKGGAGVEETEGFSGETVLASWQNNTDLGYTVYAQIPRGEALEAVSSLLLLLLGVAVVFGIFVTGFSYLFARNVTKPISMLIDASRNIASGMLDTRVPITSSDEIGLLAGTFNDMTENLQVRVYDEKRNREYLEDVLTSYMKFVERVSRGDLTSRLSLNGQTGANLIVANVDVNADDNLLRLGYNLNRMVEALHSVASQSRDVARSLSHAAGDILENSNQQLATTTQQDASVSETTATVTQVRATVLETAERAQMVAEAAQQSVEISRQGQRAVAETIEGMNVIRSRVESIAENILMLSERTTQIGDIIATVNAIADQSKMLALNASIEAARAGEEGRGFAVVAMEVRNLAEQSREATAQVRDILSEIQHATNTAVMVTEEGTKGVDLGVQLVDRAGRAIRELAGKLEEAAQAAMQIAASTRQQSQGMDQLTSAMSTIKSATSMTAAGMSQSARSAKELNEMARQMESAISAYKL